MARVERVVIPYSPRPAFAAYHASDRRYSLTVAHRRAGKTVARINKLIRKAFECQLERPRYGYLAPTYVQAKDIAWAYLKHYAAGLLKLGGKTNESELSIVLPHNEATIRLYGAENAERLRGLYFDGIAIDEAQQISPSVLTQIILPALADRGGWLDIAGTANGWVNLLGSTYKIAVNDPAWHVQVLKASETGILPDEELARLKSAMPENEYLQEMECSFEAAVSGAYYAGLLAQARREGRVGRVAADPLLTLRAFCDIGGTGARADAFAIWIAQFVGREIRVLDYYEAVGQPLGTHLEWMREKGYTPKRCQIWLPHDGASNDKVYDVSYESALKQAGYAVTVIPNQGKGAASQRVQACRRLFPSIWFNEATTRPGLDALGAYHEKRDPMRGVGLGPEHDWSSHGADAMGLLCVAYEAPAERPQQIKYPAMGVV